MIRVNEWMTSSGLKLVFATTKMVMRGKNPSSNTDDSWGSLGLNKASNKVFGCYAQLSPHVLITYSDNL